MNSLLNLAIEYIQKCNRRHKHTGISHCSKNIFKDLQKLYNVVNEEKEQENDDILEMGITVINNTQVE